MTTQLERLILLLRRDNVELTKKYMSDSQLENLMLLLNQRCQNNNVLAHQWLMAKSDVFPDSPAIAIIRGEVMKVITYLKYFK